MSPIASPSKWTFRSVVLAGGVLLIGWGVSGSTSSHQTIQQAGNQAGQLNSRAHRVQPSHHWFQLGRASWYGHSFQGQETASGEAFDMNQMTCAHRSLPLGALVRVTNLRNHRSVVVRVNDRGPDIPNRIVDLSYAAARVLHFNGMARVRLDLIDPSPSGREFALLGWPEPATR